MKTHTMTRTRKSAEPRIPSAARAAMLLLAWSVAACRNSPRVNEPELTQAPASRVPGSPSARVVKVNAMKDFAWPVPARWTHETIPFPLDFAPSLSYRGQEELRFAPGFFTPGARTFWSYDFIWWLEEEPKFDATSISSALQEYFRGLSLAVGKEKFAFDADHFRAEMAPRVEAGRSVLVGKVYTYDPFKTGQPIVLNLEACLRDCPVAAHYAITFMVSPAAFDDPVWTELRNCASAFICN